MSAAALPDIAAIDAARGEGESWLRLFDELSNLGRRRSEATRQATRDTAKPNAAPAPRPVNLAPWKSAPPRVFPLVADDPSPQAAPTFDAAHPLAIAIAPPAIHPTFSTVGPPVRQR